ncbi:MAG: chemotaxis protein CheW, partial [Planctomycetota bacterium]
MTIAIAHHHRWCSFRLGQDCFAVAAADVVEVLRSRRLARVPLAAAGVQGLVQLRGRIVPVIDAAITLGVARDPVARPPTHLVIAVGDDWYGLAVDEMLDVIEIPAERVERPAATALRAGSVAGTFAAAERLVHL